MSKIKDIYVNGIGVITAAGSSVYENIHMLASGESSLARTYRFPTELDVPVGESELSDIDLKKSLGISEEQVISRTALLGLHAVMEALTGLSFSGKKIALISGTSVGGMDLSEIFWKLYRADLAQGDVQFVKMHDPGAVTSMMAQYLKGKGLDIKFVSTVSTACSAAGNAIMLGARMLRAGMFDIVIAGGTDALCRFTLDGFNSLRILDHEICRPFSGSRAGLNLGEGAGYLVLSTSSNDALCRLSGWGNANEAYHQTASTPEGVGPRMAMSAALKNSGLVPSEISFVNTHGTGTQVNDAAEFNAMKRIFGDNLPPYTSLKSYFGHTLGASEGIEAALVCRALSDGNCSFMGADVMNPKNIMSSAFGFSGNCVSLVFSRL